MPQSERRIYLLRHAQPLIPPGGRRYIGQSDPPLSPEGTAQAERWREYFGPIALTSIFSSDLQRAAQTARIVARDQGLEVLLETGLREIHLGAWEGQTFEALRRQNPHGFERRGRDPVHFRPPGGECFDDLRLRAVPAFERIVGRTAGPILVVAHAGVNRVLLCHLLGMPLSHLFRLGQDYAALNIVEPFGAVWRVRAVNTHCLPGTGGFF